MALTRPSRAHLASAAVSAVSLVGGVSLAVVPAATLSISANVFTLAESGVIAVAIMIGTFAGQLAFAAIVESRLSSTSTARRVTFPRWLAALSLLAALLVALNHTSALVLCLGLPILLASLEVGRGVSIAERLDTREIWASVAVACGALGGVLAGFADASWALVPLVAGIFVATSMRSLRVAHRASAPEPSARAWVVADVGITGIVFPLINTLILTVLGPAGAVLFTAISTVTGLLAIPLNFLRLRLLKEHSRLDIVVSVAALIVATGALFVFEFAGFFSLLFGSAWTVAATVVPLLVACAWRAASLAPTLPFTALRRMGRARLVTLLRAGASVIALALACLGLLTLNIVAIFAALLIAELLSGVVYEVARRRVVRAETTTNI
ncbi:hypothetical protein D6T64_13205 [Cryobacterium melibiosiphilum]|uniref:Uncharacterized protein n=1 Tax=Cryobacterium melibiosiphilum TaxID=995039 RepID=A0A3A5MLT6_9MICO|nr:hypothetical protein [Cryobacterium melibiosiphilum]RJT87813.1 hypothetical protein D6T64_13205 [Cryobacterium melibiosiphilum]